MPSLFSRALKRRTSVQKLEQGEIEHSNALSFPYHPPTTILEVPGAKKGSEPFLLLADEGGFVSRWHRTKKNGSDAADTKTCIIATSGGKVSCMTVLRYYSFNRKDVDRINKIRKKDKTRNTSDFKAGRGVLATGSDDGNLKLWDMKTGLNLACIPFEHAISCIVEDISGLIIVAFSNYPYLKVVDPVGQEVIATFYGHDTAVHSLICSKTYGVFVTGDSEGLIKIWPASDKWKHPSKLTQQSLLHEATDLENKFFSVVSIASLSRPTDDEFMNLRRTFPHMAGTAGERVMIQVFIHRAENLPVADMNGRSDPYIEGSVSFSVPIGDEEDDDEYEERVKKLFAKHKQRTRVRMRTLNPSYNERFDFVLPLVDDLKVNLAVFDQDIGRSDDLLGVLSFSLNELLEGCKQHKAFPVLHDPNGLTSEYDLTNSKVIVSYSAKILTNELPTQTYTQKLLSKSSSNSKPAALSVLEFMAFGQTRLAAGFEDGRVYVWDLSFLSPNFGQVLEVPVEQQSLAPSRDEAVRLQIPLVCVNFHQGPCRSLVYESEQQFIVSGGADGLVKIWDSHTFQPRVTLPGGFGGNVSAICLPSNFLRKKKMFKKHRNAGGVVVAAFVSKQSKTSALWSWKT